MSDLFYNFVWGIGTPAFLISARPTIINLDATLRQGPYILASNHQSPYDVALLIRHVRRKVDFVSIVEVFKNPFVAWFYGSMNAFPLDRHRPDAPTVRTILDRLKKGRVVGMFPEGQLRPLDRSVVTGGSIRKGVGKIAALAGVPVIPVVVLNSTAYRRFTSWMPLRRTWYGMNFGHPLEINPNLDSEAAADDLELRLCEALRNLYSELKVKQPGS